MRLTNGSHDVEITVQAEDGRVLTYNQTIIVSGAILLGVIRPTVSVKSIGWDQIIGLGAVSTDVTLPTMQAEIVNPVEMQAGTITSNPTLHGASVTEVQPISIISCTPVKMGSPFTITVSGNDLTTFSAISLMLGGIDLGNASNVTSTTATFIAPVSGLAPNSNQNLVLGTSTATADITGVTVGADTITITGSGLGTKTQAAPVLAVFGSEVYENGVASTAEAGLAQGAPVPTDQLWNMNQYVTIDKTDLRTGLVDQMYLARGDQGGESVVGWPNEMLSISGDRESSIYNNKLYTSFYTKFSTSPFYYRAVAVTGVTGTFDTGLDEFDLGEAISFDGLTGKVLHYDATGGILHLVVDSTGSSTNFDNKVITGLTSGATCTAQSGTLYSNPAATKIFRAYENVVGDAIRTAFSPTGCVVGGYQGATELYRVTTSETLRPGSWTDWHQVEFFADNSGTTGNGRIKQSNDVFTWSGLDLTQKSPTNGLVPSNIGFDLSGVPTDIFIKQWFGEIYVDTTPQRVVVGDNVDFSLCTKFDHLIPESWSGTQIVLKKRNVNGYLFVVDANDQPVSTAGTQVTTT